MIAAANHAAVSFFKQTPERAVPAVSRAWEMITYTPALSCDGVLLALCNELDELGLQKPNKAEFGTWFRGVRTGAVPQPTGPVMADIIGLSTVEHVEQIGQAFGVVAAGHALAEAKLAAGYDAMCVQSQDDLVCEAIKDLLTNISQTGEPPAHAPHDRSPMMVALDLLEPFTPDTHDRLLDAIVTEFGAELCAALTTTFIPSTGAAAQ